MNGDISFIRLTNLDDGAETWIRPDDIRLLSPVFETNRAREKTDKVIGTLVVTPLAQVTAKETIEGIFELINQLAPVTTREIAMNLVEAKPGPEGKRRVTLTCPSCEVRSTRGVDDDGFYIYVYCPCGERTQIPRPA